MTGTPCLVSGAKICRYLMATYSNEKAPNLLLCRPVTLLHGGSEPPGPRLLYSRLRTIHDTLSIVGPTSYEQYQLIMFQTNHTGGWIITRLADDRIGTLWHSRVSHSLGML